MTEATTETQATATETGEQEAQTQTKPTETVEFWKAQAREQEKRAKANATAATKLEEIENAKKSSEERAAEALTAAEKRAVGAEVKALRLEVAFEKGLTPDQAKRLVGESREDLEADADDLLATFKPSNGDNESTTAKPVLDLDLGARGTAKTSASGNPAADFEKFLKGALS